MHQKLPHKAAPHNQPKHECKIGQNPNPAKQTADNSADTGNTPIDEQKKNRRKADQHATQKWRPIMRHVRLSILQKMVCSATMSCAAFASVRR